MKTLIVILFMFFSIGLMGQALVLKDQFVTTDTITADTGYQLKTSADYSWLLFMTWESLADSSSTVACQVSGNNGTDYASISGYATINMDVSTGTTGFQGDFSPGNKYRLYVDVGDNDTVIINAWYTLKTKTR